MRIRKVIIGTVLALALFFIACYYYINWAFNQPCPPPSKPLNIPVTTKWKGGCDGGHWIELISISDNKYRFRIYLDWNGELLLDSDFSLKDCGENITFSVSNWHEFISWFSGENLEIRNFSEQKDWRCRLVPIYPAYGGSQWDVIREKKEY